RRHRDRPPARRVGRPPHAAARPPVRAAPRGALRRHRGVRRPRPGRHRHLGDPPPQALRKGPLSDMTDYSKIDFSELAAAFADDEVVTPSYVRDIRLPSGRVLALITLDNDRDHTRPSTLGPVTMLELGARLDELQARAAAGEIHA